MSELAFKQLRFVNRDRPTLLHDNAQPHIAQRTLLKLQEFTIFIKPYFDWLSCFPGYRLRSNKMNPSQKLAFSYFNYLLIVRLCVFGEYLTTFMIWQRVNRLILFYMHKISQTNFALNFMIIIYIEIEDMIDIVNIWWIYKLIF